MGARIRVLGRPASKVPQICRRRWRTRVPLIGCSGMGARHTRPRGLRPFGVLFGGRSNRPGDRRAGTVGRPLPLVQVTIEQGEIVVSGPTVMNGYLSQSGTVDPCSPWRTGDLGYFDPDGFLYVTGRKDNVIVTSGRKKRSSRMDRRDHHGAWPHYAVCGCRTPERIGRRGRPG